MDTPRPIPYIEYAMYMKFTTCLLLAAIAIQGVFGGLQESVSICLGGGHTHEVAVVIEHCAFECSHRNDWVTPTTNEEHINNCECTDLDLGLIVLLTTPRVHDSNMVIAPASFIIVSFADQATLQSMRVSLPSKDDLGMMHRIAVIASTRLRI